MDDEKGSVLWQPLECCNVGNGKNTSMTPGIQVSVVNS